MKEKIAVIGLGYVGAAGRARVRAQVPGLRRLRHPPGEGRRAARAATTATARSRDESSASTTLAMTSDPAELDGGARSSSSPCPRRSTTTTSRISRRVVARVARRSAGAAQGRGGGLRVDRLPGRDRGRVRPDPRQRVAACKSRRRLQARLLARAHQPGRQGAHASSGSRRSSRARTRRRSSAWPACTARSSRRACTARRRIKVAEAAKVIENTQRDLNIALMNELAIIFDRMGIRTSDVLAAAGTKWNFLKFRPGLVGGHCIGVDPYYLTMKAQQLGYQPGGHPRRPAHQQRHGSVRRAAPREAAHPRRHPREGRAGRRPRAHVQGELQRPPQQQGRRTSSTELRQFGIDADRPRPARERRRGDARVRADALAARRASRTSTAWCSP